MEEIIGSILQGSPQRKENSLLSRSKDIIKVLFFLDLILLIVSLFYVSKTFLIMSLLANVILTGSYLILQKYYMLFDMMITSSKISKSLNGALGKLDG